MWMSQQEAIGPQACHRHSVCAEVWMVAVRCVCWGAVQHALGHARPQHAVTV